ncbi:flagellar protein FliT [Dyella sp. 20L07]|uniref:flagellar protein FliT n=1 Tax=Dyella sp. 20L07 TaxID=3384240 RepID=UPI003D284BD9
MDNDDILQISARMAAAARAGDWDAVSSHDAERSRLLQQLPVTDPSVGGTLKTLLDDNEEIRVLAAAAREAARQELGDHQHRHRALSVYLHAGVD